MTKTFTPKQRDLIITVITAIFVMLFLYVAVDKWRHFYQFKKSMYNQPISDQLVGFLVDILPAAELMIAILLLINKTRYLGLWLATLSMAVFTLYVATIIAHQFEYMPCSCAGIFQNLSWKNHLIVNIGLLLAGITALWVYPRRSQGLGKMNVQATNF